MSGTARLNSVPRAESRPQQGAPPTWIEAAQCNARAILLILLLCALWGLLIALALTSS